MDPDDDETVPGNMQGGSSSAPSRERASQADCPNPSMDSLRQMLGLLVNSPSTPATPVDCSNPTSDPLRQLMGLLLSSSSRPVGLSGTAPAQALRLQSLLSPVHQSQPSGGAALANDAAQPELIQTLLQGLGSFQTPPQSGYTPAGEAVADANCNPQLGLLRLLLAPRMSQMFGPSDPSPGPSTVSEPPPKRLRGASGSCKNPQLPSKGNKGKRPKSLDSQERYLENSSCPPAAVLQLLQNLQSQSAAASRELESSVGQQEEASPNRFKKKFILLAEKGSTRKPDAVALQQLTEGGLGVAELDIVSYDTRDQIRGKLERFYTNLFEAGGVKWMKALSGNSSTLVPICSAERQVFWMSGAEIKATGQGTIYLVPLQKSIALRTPPKEFQSCVYCYEVFEYQALLDHMPRCYERSGERHQTAESTPATKKSSADHQRDPGRVLRSVNDDPSDEPGHPSCSSASSHDSQTAGSQRGSGFGQNDADPSGGGPPSSNLSLAGVAEPLAVGPPPSSLNANQVEELLRVLQDHRGNFVQHSTSEALVAPSIRGNCVEVERQTGKWDEQFSELIKDPDFLVNLASPLILTFTGEDGIDCSGLRNEFLSKAVEFYEMMLPALDEVGFTPYEIQNTRFGAGIFFALAILQANILTPSMWSNYKERKEIPGDPYIEGLNRLGLGHLFVAHPELEELFKFDTRITSNLIINLLRPPSNMDRLRKIVFGFFTNFVENVGNGRVKPLLKECAYSVGLKEVYPAHISKAHLTISMADRLFDSNKGSAEDQRDFSTRK